VANLKSKKKVSGEALLYAVGRQGNVDELNLAAGGLEADARGRIAWIRITGPRSRISLPLVTSLVSQSRLGLHGAGASPPPERLAFRRTPTARIILRHLHHPRNFLHRKNGGAIDGRRLAYEVGMAFFREIARGQIRGDTTGRLKILFDPSTKQLLGVHIIGEGASELLHIGQAVFALKGTVEYFVDTVFNYPTLAECYKAAAFNGLNKLARN